MSVSVAVPDRLFSREEYRAWCEAQPSGRFERVDGRIVAMAAERAAHVRMKLAIAIVLRRAVANAGIECEALGDGVTVEVGDNDFEPDTVVNCGPRIGDDDIAAPNPVVVVEVLSPGTQSVDTGRKFVGYFGVASVMHYLIIHPTKRIIVHHRRAGDAIASRIVPAGEIVMDPPGMTITLEEVYEEAGK